MTWTAAKEHKLQTMLANGSKGSDLQNELGLGRETARTRHQEFHDPNARVPLVSAEAAEWTWVDGTLVNYAVNRVITAESKFGVDPDPKVKQQRLGEFDRKRGLYPHQHSYYSMASTGRPQWHSYRKADGTVQGIHIEDLTHERVDANLQQEGSMQSVYQNRAAPAEWTLIDGMLVHNTIENLVVTAESVFGSDKNARGQEFAKFDNRHGLFPGKFRTDNSKTPKWHIYRDDDGTPQGVFPEYLTQKVISHNAKQQNNLFDEFTTLNDPQQRPADAPLEKWYGDEFRDTDGTLYRQILTRDAYGTVTSESVVVEDNNPSHVEDARSMPESNIGGLPASGTVQEHGSGFYSGGYSEHTEYAQDSGPSVTQPPLVRQPSYSDFDQTQQRWYTVHTSTNTTEWHSRDEDTGMADVEDNRQTPRGSQMPAESREILVEADVRRSSQRRSGRRSNTKSKGGMDFIFGSGISGKRR
jgi:hypothetical protein